MEVASFVFGALPVALYALDNYHRCLRPAKNYWKYDITLQQMRSHVFLQQEQLNATMAVLGLNNPTTAQLRDHLGRVYTQEKCERFMNILDRMKELLEDMMEKLDIDAQGKPKWSDAPPERVEWEWRKVKRSFGDKKRKELIDELQFWNSGLKAIVEKAEVPLPDEEANSPVKKIQHRLGAQQCDKIRKGLGFVHRAFQKTGWNCHCSEHQAVIRLGWHMDQTAVGSDFSFGFAGLHGPSPWQLISVNIEEKEEAKLVTPPTPTRSPSPSKPEPKKRFLRFSMGRKKEQDSVGDAQTSNLVVQSPSPNTPPLPQHIACMCSFIHGARGNEAGVIHIELDSPNSGLVAVKIVKGGATDANSEVRRLGSLLSSSEQQRQSDILLLSRKQRLGIAAAVTWAALYLCGTPWLGSNWNGKDDVQVFLETQRQQHRRTAVLATHPGISYVFRSESCQEMATPKSDTVGFQTRLIPNKALFTLGILLLELCLGKTFEQIHREAKTRVNNMGPLTENADEKSSERPPPSEYDITTDFIDQVYLSEGDLYGDAIRRCLRCEFPGRDVTKDFIFQPFRKHFLEGVVAPVQATFESCL